MVYSLWFFELQQFHNSFLCACSASHNSIA
jgi:hypothetical protein